MNTVEYTKRLSSLLATSRAETEVSQETMALELGVSRGTIANWEKGLSKPDIIQFLQWFEVLGKNPTSSIFEFANPVKFENLFQEESDADVDDALNEMISSLSLQQKKGILYLLYGTYQGDPFAMLQLFIAHAHLPMEYRFSVANQICEIYKLCERANMLKDTERVMPNIPALEEAIQKGREAAIHKKDGY